MPPHPRSSTPSGGPSLNHDSLEADDLLGSLAKLEVDAGGRALLLTGDRDMFQCASDAVTVLYLSTGVRGATEIDPAEVERRYGVAPELVPDFIALRGDPSDGLPGAKGVGEKTAADLLRKHGSLEGVLDAAIAETRPKLRVALLDSRDELLAFKRDRDAPGRRGQAPAGPRHRSAPGRAEGGARAGDERARRTARRDAAR